MRHALHPVPAVIRPSYTVIIPTLGRPCLQDCLDALAAAAGPLPDQVVLADDRPDTPDPLPVRLPPALADRTMIVTLEGRGPAAARNAGWRAACATEWVAFLDDDVVVGPAWRAGLVADLAAPAGPGGRGPGHHHRARCRTAAGPPTGNAARRDWPRPAGSRRTWPTGAAR